MNSVEVAKGDEFAKGMVKWEDDDFQNINNYINWQVETVRPLLGERVLEVGAGHGVFASLLLKKRDFERYVAIEPSVNFFEKLQKRLPQVETANKTLDDLDDSYDGQFDSIFSVHVLEHIEDDVAFLRNAKRLLRPGGRMIFLVPALNCLMSQMDRNIGHFRRYNKQMIIDIAGQAGYSVVQLKYDNFIGILGWWWFCKIRNVHYQTKGKKKKLMWAFNFFDKVVLPTIGRMERVFPPPVGLSLTGVLEKPADENVRGGTHEVS